MTKQTLKKNLAAVGEEISHELGIKMIQDYRNANTSFVPSYQIGKNIIESIMAQPGCVAMRFYNALNELGEKTLVYVGVNENNEVIAEYIAVNSIGELQKQKGIVADRIKPPPPPPSIDRDSDISWGLPE